MIQLFRNIILILVVFYGAPALSQARGVDDILSGILRNSGDVAQASTRHLNEFSSAIIRNTGDLGRSLGKGTDELLSFLQKTDPALARQISEAADPRIRNLLANADAGARVFRNGIKDPVTRWNLIRDTGTDGLVLAARHGSAGTKALRFVDDGIRYGKLANSGVTLANAAQNLSKLSDKAWESFATYILPNWKGLTAAGLTASLLLNPEGTISALGEITGPVAAELARLGVSVPTAAVEILGEAVIDEVRDISTNPERRWPFLLGTGLLFTSVLAWRFRRHLLRKILGH